MKKKLLLMILVSVTLTASLIGCSKVDAENATVENSVAEPKKEKCVHGIVINFKVIERYTN